jgi:hypothetical protein
MCAATCIVSNIRSSSSSYHLFPEICTGLQIHIDMENGHINTKCTKTITIFGALVPYSLRNKIMIYKNSLLMVLTETEDGDLNIYVFVNTKLIL